MGAPPGAPIVIRGPLRGFAGTIRMVTRRLLIWMSVLALSVSACGESSAPAGPTGAAEPAEITEATETTMQLEPPDSTLPDPTITQASSSGGATDREQAPDGMLRPVLEDAAARTGVDPSEVEVVESEFKDWPDGALGCPVPGMLYTQVVTAGYRIVVEAGGERLDYRMDRRGAFRLCESPPQIPDLRTTPTVIPGTTSPDM